MWREELRLGEALVAYILRSHRLLRRREAEPLLHERVQALHDGRSQAVRISECEGVSGFRGCRRNQLDTLARYNILLHSREFWPRAVVAFTTPGDFRHVRVDANRYLMWLCLHYPSRYEPEVMDRKYSLPVRMSHPKVRMTLRSAEWLLSQTSPDDISQF